MSYSRSCLSWPSFWLHERIKLANKNLWFVFKLWCSTQWTFTFHANCWKTLEYWGPCTEGNRFWKGNCVIIDLKEKRKGVVSRNLFIFKQWEVPPNWVKRKNNLLKTLNEGTNNTANTRGGTDGLNLWKIETDCEVDFWKLVGLTRFPNSFLVLVTFDMRFWIFYGKGAIQIINVIVIVIDIMLGNYICVTWSFDI